MDNEDFPFGEIDAALLRIETCRSEAQRAEKRLRVAAQAD